jgi:hypothetical protein
MAVDETKLLIVVQQMVLSIVLVEFVIVLVYMALGFSDLENIPQKRGW